MKRYLLLALLFGIVFLGLGNGYTSAVCETQKTNHSSLVWTSHTFTCQYSGADAPAVCNEYGQTCFPDTTCNASLGLECCVCNKPPATTPTPPSTTGTTPPSTTGTTPPSTTGTIPTVTGTNATGGTGGTTPSGGGSNGGAGSSAQNNCTGNNEEPNAFGVCKCIPNHKRVNGVCVSCSEKGVCCGIELNTNVPFIGRCIEGSIDDVSNDEQAVTSEDAFPVLMGSLTQILVTIILIVSFVLIIVGGIMISTGNPSGGKSLIIKVVVGIALLGASGVILRLINPNFFG